MLKIRAQKGFTLIEILVVIAIIAILAAIVLVAINPAKRFQDARNSQRRANVESILSAIQQNMVDNKGIWNCAVALPGTATDISKANLDIYPCLSTYLAILPVDPGANGVTAGTFVDGTNYDTKYQVYQNAAGQVTVQAVPATATADGVSTGISVTR